MVRRPFPSKKNRIVEKIRTRTLSGAQGQDTRFCPQQRKDHHPRRAFHLSTSTDTAANLQVYQVQKGSVPSPLFSLFLSPPSSSLLFPEALGAISRGFGDHQCCALGATIACRWCTVVGPHPSAPDSKPWIPLLTMTITGHCRRK